MDLKSVLTGKATLEFYWALVIEPGWVQAGIWNTHGCKANVVSIGPSAAWETDDELTSACDTALSAAIQNLPEDAGEPTKTVFGVSSSWVSEGQIKAEFLEKIKKICSALSLTPVGFVVLSEAISYYLKNDEGVPLNAIVIGIGTENIEISVFKLGNLQGNQIISRSVSVADDVSEGLSRFASLEALPSRILIYDGKEGQLDEVRQSLMNTNWEDYEKVKFLHTPKIEIITPDNKILATALAGGAEMADAKSVEKPQVVEETKETPTVVPEEIENLEKPRGEELGFVMGKDIGQDFQDSQKPSLQENQSKPPTEYQNQTSFRESAIKPKLSAVLAIKGKISEIIKNTVSKVNGFLEKFGAHKSPVISQGSTVSGKKVTFVGVGLIIVFFVLAFIFWWYYPKAVITIYVSPQKLEERTLVSIDTEIFSTNFENKILPGNFISEKQEGEKTLSTTGTKTVGEKAKGEVTLYRSGFGVTLPAGTKLGGSGGLGFTLNESVVIASGSASTPGTAKASVTALDIGAEYNLASGETFSVSNYPKSELEAKNESAFSGGSSREINAVSQEDLDKLEEELKAELEEKAEEKITNSLAENKFFIEESVSSEILEESFSNKVGDEASTIKLSLSLEVKGLVVEKVSLLDLAKEVLKNKVAQGYVLREDQIEIRFESAQETENAFEFEAIFNANLLPEINTDKIKKDVAGKYPDLAEEFLSGIEGFTRVSITMKPRFPGRLGTLPRIVKNMTIEISAD